MVVGMAAHDFWQQRRALRAAGQDAAAAADG
jgi:hypothetical protein